jgi:hypothetical protein
MYIACTSNLISNNLFLDHVTQLANLFDELSFFLPDHLSNKSFMIVFMLFLIQSYGLQYMVLHSIVDISQARALNNNTQ